MGANQSKEEQLYKEVQNRNHDAVKALHRDGASLEWVDKKGRTPLILSCTRDERLDMAVTLLNLGANINAYRAGARGGFPLHHAAKNGLEKTAALLLSRGANPFAVNDDGQTALEIARSKCHVAVVRLLEDKLCLFSGTLREVSGFGILKSLAPNLVTKKIWGVVLPIRPALYELAIYESPKVTLWNGARSSSTHPAGPCNVAQPRTRISLANAEIQGPNFTLLDPAVCVLDNAKTKCKLYAGTKGDKAQLARFRKACEGSALAQDVAASGNDNNPYTTGHPGGTHQLGNQSQVYPVNLQRSPGRQPVPQSLPAPSSGVSITVNFNTPIGGPIPEDLAMAVAHASIRTVAQAGIPLSRTTSEVVNNHQLNEWAASASAYRSWNSFNLNKHQDQRVIKSSYADWKGEQHSFNSWAGDGSSSSLQGGSSNVQPSGAAPSAPPFPEMANGNPRDEGAGGICVVCCDACADGACIPCGHLAGCMNCLTELKSKTWNCPVCRGPIEQIVKVYAV